MWCWICLIFFLRVIFVFLLQNDNFVRVGFFLVALRFRRVFYAALLFNRKEIQIILSGLRTHRPKNNVKNTFCRDFLLSVCQNVDRNNFGKIGCLV